MNIKPLFLICVCVLGLNACSSYKKLEKKQEDVKAPSSVSKHTQTQETSLFFDAEKARLLGDTKLAYNLYTSFVESYPANATARYNLARLQFQRQELAAAEKNAQKSVELAPQNKYFIEFYAQILSYLKKNKQAESLINNLVATNPEDEEYLYKQAMFYLKEKEYDKAIQSIDKLEKLTGFNEDLVIQKKNIYAKQGKTELAINEIKKLREIYPQSAQFPIMMIDVYESAGQKEKVKLIYEDLEVNYSEDPIAQVELSQYFIEQKNIERSNQYMKKVMKNKNLDVETKISLLLPTLKFIETGTPDEKDLILTMSKSISEESPENKDAVSLYADVLYFSKKNDEALVEYKKYLKLDKSKFSIWNQLLSIYLDKQQYDSVLAYADKSLEVFPNNALPYFFKGISYVQLKESDKAIKPLNQSLELETENTALIAQIYSTLGDVYNTKQNYSYSDSCFEKSLKILPNDATTLNNYAYYLSLRKTKLDDAERMSKKSLELMPESKSFLDTYGWILYQQGKYTEAKSYMDRALKANGEEDPTLLEHMGDIYYKLNDKSKAVDYWKKAQMKGESNPTLLKKISDEKLYE
jgi:tetratricopeptide (TPR) repeat protein